MERKSDLVGNHAIMMVCSVACCPPSSGDFATIATVRSLEALALCFEFTLRT